MAKAVAEEQHVAANIMLQRHGIAGELAEDHHAEYGRDFADDGKDEAAARITRRPCCSRSRSVMLRMICQMAHGQQRGADDHDNGKRGGDGGIGQRAADRRRLGQVDRLRCRHSFRHAPR